MNDFEANKKYKFSVIDRGTITSVPDFYASSCYCGIKKSKNEDFCIIYTESDACCSGVFTTNKFIAAPVVVSKEQLENSRNIKAIVVNSGIANACTGVTGYINAKNTIDLASRYLGIDSSNILVSSTGIIGKQLPMEKIKKGIEICSKKLSPDGGNGAAKAILTTDKYEKEIAVRVGIDDNKEEKSSNFNIKNYNRKDIIIGGIAKGSGMVAPNMATMLSFISSNVKIPSTILDKLIFEGVERSFNCITIDGCQSTNDMVIIQTNSQSGIEIESEKDKNFNKFKAALFFVLEELAKKIVEDGEGATKLIEININKAKSRIEAKKIGMKVANSMLFKTAMFGKDLNWGRINAAIGSADCYIKPDRVDIYLEEIPIVKDGIEVKFNQKYVDKLMERKNIKFTIDLNMGKEKCKIWTTDLSYEYININSLYHT